MMPLTLGEKIRMLRVGAGMNVRQAGAAVGVSGQAFSLYERDKLRPRAAVIDGIQRTFPNIRRPALEQEVAPMDLWVPAWVSKKEQGSLRKTVIPLAERRAEIEAYMPLPWFSRSPAQVYCSNNLVSLKAYSQYCKLPMTNQELAIAQAAYVRGWMELGDTPIGSMRSVLEKHGILVAYSMEIMGFLCFASNGADGPGMPVIVVWDECEAEISRFLLARWLGALLLSREREAKPDLKAADRFARAFLMPYEHLRSSVGSKRKSLAHREVDDLRRVYGVSARALLLALFEAEIIDAKCYRNAMKLQDGWLLEQPCSEVRQREFVMPKLDRLVLRAVAEGLITVKRASLWMAVTEETVRDMLDVTHFESPPRSGPLGEVRGPFSEATELVHVCMAQMEAAKL